MLRIRYMLCLIAVMIGVASGLLMANSTSNPSGDDSAPKPLLHYTFDQRDKQIIFDRSGSGLHGSVFGQTDLIPHKGGKAMRFDGATGYILLPDSDILTIDGDMTIEVWLKPEDADQFIDDRLIIGHTAPLGVGRNYYMFLTKYARYAGLLRVDHADGTVNDIFMTDTPPFDGEWKHVAYVAEYPYQYYYIDGQLVKRQKMITDITPMQGGQYSVGGWSKESGGYGFYKGAMDDLKVYDSALSVFDIAKNLTTVTAEVGTASDKMGINIHVNSLEIEPEMEIASTLSHIKKQLSVEVFMDGVASSAKTLRCELLLPGSEPNSSPIVISKPIETTRPGSARAFISYDFALDKMAAGDYRISAKVLDDTGETIRQITKTHPSMGKPEWWNSTEGITDEVPAPWIPVVVEANDTAGYADVSVWGRTYRFESFFPKQIISKGENLLDAEISILLKTDNGTIDIESSKPIVINQSPASVDIKITGSAEGLTLEANHHIEYDGLIKSTWAITSDGQETIDQLRFDIPLKSEHAVYHYNSEYYDHFLGDPAAPKPIHHSGLLNDGIVERPFTPMISFLDDERGIQWVCESRRNWYNRDDQRAIAIRKNSDRTVLSLNLVDKPVSIENKSLEYTFGLMPGPVKPMTEPDGWTQRITGDGFGLYGNAYNWPEVTVAGKPVHEYYKSVGYDVLIVQGLNRIMGVRAPVGDEIPKMHALMADIHQYGLKAIPYFGYQISEISPEWTDFGQDVLVIPRLRNSDSYPGWTPQYVNATCLNSYQSGHFIDTIVGMVDDFGIDGVYIDTTTVPHLCKNTVHGCGYVDENGKLQCTMPVFAIRDTFQRLYVAMKKRNPNAVIDIHASRSILIPAVAYATRLWTGEQIDIPQVENPLDKLPLDRFRAEFRGNAWGIQTDLLTFNLCPFGTALGYSLLHDIPARPIGTILRVPDTFSRTANVLQEFGRLESQFLPYWKNGEYVSSSSPDVYISLYKHPSNGVLAVVMNLSPSTRSSTITCNTAKLDLADNITVRNAYYDNSVPATNNSFSVNMAKFAWDIYHIR